MQAVILAAGKSTRTYPLTLTRPKPLLKIANKTILEHNLDNLTGIVNEVILIVGYKKEMIRKQFGNKYKNIKLRYAEQKEQLGTGHALLTAEKYIKSEFLSLYGDDVYSKEDIKNTVKNKYSILVKEVGNPSLFGVILEKNSILKDLIEKPEVHISNLVNTGLYKLDKKIFSAVKHLKESERGEYEITDAIKYLSKKENIYCVKAKQWLPVGYLWDLLKADKILRKNKNLIGTNSRIAGKVVNSGIGSNCIIKGDIKNSVVMDSTIIEKDSVVEDSIIGNNVYFSGKAISKADAHSMVGDKKIKAGRLGAIVADNVRADNITINPGCKIWPNKCVSNTEIKEDLM